MANAILGWAVVVGLAIVSVGCSGSESPIAPTRNRSLPAAAGPVNSADFPVVSKPARIYGSAAPLAFALQSYTLGSRFVLYDDGTFALQYDRGFEYRGTYKEDNGGVTFEWEGWSTAGPWGATGSLVGRNLTVRFNLVMAMSDFEDAIYTLVE